MPSCLCRFETAIPTDLKALFWARYNHEFVFSFGAHAESTMIQFLRFCCRRFVWHGSSVLDGAALCHGVGAFSIKAPAVLVLHWSYVLGLIANYILNYFLTFSSAKIAPAASKYFYRVGDWMVFESRSP